MKKVGNKKRDKNKVDFKVYKNSSLNILFINLIFLKKINEKIEINK